MSEPANRAFDALVAGHSPPALQTALDLAEVGLRVAVAPPAVDRPARTAAERDPDGVVAAFMTRIAQPVEQGDAEPDSSALPLAIGPSGPLLLGPKGQWLPQAEPQVLGIPASPLASAVFELLGTRGALRAYLDRLKPLLTVGKTRSIGELVRARMGAAVLQRLVEPQVFERFGLSAHDVDVALAAPGLNEALSRAGALSAGVLAYADRNVARETAVAATGGPARLTRAALRRLELYGVQLLPEHVSAAHSHDEGWTVQTADGERFEARSLVLDQGDEPTPLPGSVPDLEPVLPEAMRVYASTEIDRPAWLVAGASGVALAGGWSLRAEAGEDADGVSARARFGSAVLPAGGFAAGTGREALERELEAALSQAGLARAVGAEWQVRMAAAPFAEIEQRDSARAALDALTEQQPTLLAVGRALHGDGLGEALGSAHLAAVALRRRLLGLAPEHD